MIVPITLSFISIPAFYYEKEDEKTLENAEKSLIHDQNQHKALKFSRHEPAAIE
jgi:hypothetical protein